MEDKQVLPRRRYHPQDRYVADTPQQPHTFESGVSGAEPTSKRKKKDKYSKLEKLDATEPVLDAVDGSDMNRKRLKPGLETQHQSLHKRKLEHELAYRPPCTWDAATDGLLFQSLDMSYVTQKGVYPAQRAVRFYGTSKDGNSVCLDVTGFSTYMYIMMREYDTNGEPIDPTALDTDGLMRRINASTRSNRDTGGDSVASITIEQHRSIMGYSGSNPRNFARITMNNPFRIAAVKKLVGESTLAPELTRFAFETDGDILMRFLVDRSIVGSSWLEVLPGNCYAKPRKETTCQIEAECDYEDLVPHDPNDPAWGHVQPLVVLSFDIECVAKIGFPVPIRDPVVTICATVQRQRATSTPLDAVFTLNSCSDIAGAYVQSFNSEVELLNAFEKFVQDTDPDVITGYNIQGFDLPYMIDRAVALDMKDWGCFGRIVGLQSEYKETTFCSNQVGSRKSNDVSMPGRMLVDMMLTVQRDYKLRSYTLNAVASEFIGECKDDVHHSIIGDLFRGDADTRHRLASYCLKDAQLPYRLLEKLCVLFNYIEMARVAGVPFSYLLTRGQQVKVMSQVSRKARQRGFLVPTPPGQSEGDQIKGATVMDPIKGFYDEPIATLDFSSLYPSIMIAHNLCYTTLLSPDDARAMDPSRFHRSPDGSAFVGTECRQGILPEVLGEFLSARKHVKKLMKTEIDPFMKQVLNARQLALKVSANSVYGFTGTQNGKLPCFDITRAVTAYGREMIERTKQYVESRYTVANGMPANAVVLYGDTDSVMVNFHVATVAEAMDLGRKYATEISATFVAPISLEFEKVYFPYLLINKKRYAGVYWTNPDTYDRIDAKGIETVRRDSAGIVRTLMELVLKTILIDRDVDRAIQIVHNTLRDLLTGRIDMSMLVISKQLTKPIDSYKAKAGHIELAKRLALRDPLSAPNIGDRIPYVVVKGPKGAKVSEQTEDPLYVLEHSLPIDTSYYLEKQIKKPLLRVFEFLNNPNQRLFVGEHMRSINLSSDNKQSGIMKFLKRQEVCSVCSMACEEGQALCKSCKEEGQGTTAFLHAIQTEKLHARLFARVWSECQQCSRSCMREVQCSSKDCPLFYVRRKVERDVATAHNVLFKFQTKRRKIVVSGDG